MASSDLTSLSGYQTSFLQRRATPDKPPPAPPKSNRPRDSSSHGASSSFSSSTGPPLPPPPPPDQMNMTSSPQLHRTELPGPPAPQPPQPGEQWLPDLLHEKTTQQLASFLESSEKMRALAQVHPSLHPSHSPLPPLLAQTSQMSTQLSQQHAQLLALRERTQGHLLQLHALERQWREKQAQMDRQLEPWSAKTLYARLREAEQEAESISEGLESSWLDGDGLAEDRDVSDFLKGFKEGRGRVWRRREMRQRWDEGRVGGWR